MSLFCINLPTSSYVSQSKRHSPYVNPYYLTPVSYLTLFPNIYLLFSEFQTHWLP